MVGSDRSFLCERVPESFGPAPETTFPRGGAQGRQPCLSPAVRGRRRRTVRFQNEEPQLERELKQADIRGGRHFSMRRLPANRGRPVRYELGEQRGPGVRLEPGPEVVFPFRPPEVGPRALASDEGLRMTMVRRPLRARLAPFAAQENGGRRSEPRPD